MTREEYIKDLVSQNITGREIVRLASQFGIEEEEEVKTDDVAAQDATVTSAKQEASESLDGESLSDEEKATAAAEAKEKGNANANASLISESLFGTNNKDRSSAYEKSSKALDQFKTNFPDVFKGTNTQDRLRKAESDRLSDQFLKDKQNAPHSNAVRRLEEQHAKNMEALKTKKFDF